MSNTYVWVLHYVHRHGEHLSVYKTQEGAEKACWKLLKENDDEILSAHAPKEQEQYLRAVENKDLDTAIVTFCNLTEESITLESVTLYP